MKKITIHLMLFVLFTTVLNAQEINVSGELRPRYEYRHGFKELISADQSAANFISQRTRLNFDYKEEKYTVFFAIQNVRVWGDVPTMTYADANGVTFHEAWGEYHFNPKVSVKLGRQEISYDDQRIFGAVGWAQQARSHDAMLLKVKTGEKGKLHVGFALNANEESLYKQDYALAKQYKYLQYAWYNTKLNEALGLSALFLNNGMPYEVNGNQQVTFSQTLGARLTYNKNRLKANAASYFQGGETPISPISDKTDLSAYYATLNASFKITDNFSLGAGFELLSGTDQDSNSADDNSFKPFYGTNHKFNGWMDYFYVGNHMNSVGLIDINTPLVYTKNKLVFKLIPHFFQAEGNIINPKDNEKADAYLGTEIDFTIGYKLHKSIAINVGYSQMFAGESMEIIKGADRDETNDWAWAMITFKPTFFNKKFEKTEN